MSKNARKFLHWAIVIIAGVLSTASFGVELAVHLLRALGRAPADMPDPGLVWIGVGAAVVCIALAGYGPELARGVGAIAGGIGPLIGSWRGKGGGQSNG